MRPTLSHRLALLTFSCSLTLSSALAQQPDDKPPEPLSSATLSGLKLRSLGPAVHLQIGPAVLVPDGAHRTLQVRQRNRMPQRDAHV